MSDQEQEATDELQLREEETTPVVTKKRHRNNETALKLEAIEYAKQNSVHSAAKKFKVAPKTIREWKAKEGELHRQSESTPGGAKRRRLDGGGRPLLHPDIDEQLAEWAREMRENRQVVSRRIITNKAAELFKDTDVKVSNGWLGSFMNRNNFVIRRRTTTCQKPPENYTEAIARFIVHVERRRREAFFTEIYAMDETAVWFDCPDNRCIETKGAKEVTIVTTGHAKMRITVCLSARSDGRKMLPYVLVKNKRPIPALVHKFKDKLVINFAGSIWMNDSTTEAYLRDILKGRKLFGGKRLLVWDAFGSHKSEATTAVLKELDLEAAYIPGGCTKFIQAPDVSWNKPFKERIRHSYQLWMLNGDRREYTPAGNPKAPSLEVVLEWVQRAWDELSKEVIVKSFEACALTTPTDGSGDDKIACFKEGSSIGVRGLDILRQVRADDSARDGANDYEEAGLSDNNDEDEAETSALELDDLPDEEDLFFD